LLESRDIICIEILSKTELTPRRRAPLKIVNYGAEFFRKIELSSWSRDPINEKTYFKEKSFSEKENQIHDAEFFSKKELNLWSIVFFERENQFHGAECLSKKEPNPWSKVLLKEGTKFSQYNFFSK
jgi:hypothetical protein